MNSPFKHRKQIGLLAALLASYGALGIGCMKAGDGVGVDEHGAANKIVAVDSCARLPKPAGCKTDTGKVDTTKIDTVKQDTAQGLSFSAKVLPILTANCEECHKPTGQAYATTKLSMLPADAYTSLVNVLSVESKGYKRVLPKNPDSSYIIIKLTKKTPPVGGQMPLNKAALSDADVGVIRQWILDGAKP